MKKSMVVCMILVLFCTLCACGMEAKTAETSCGHEAYLPLIARLEAGDYEGARDIIDEMAGEPTRKDETQQTIPISSMPEEKNMESAVTGDPWVVELTDYNAKDYFEFTEEFHIGDKSWCTQYVKLKEEYKDRLISADQVVLEISCQRYEAYGVIDQEEEEFQAKQYLPESQTRETQVIALENNGEGWITEMTQYSAKGYFPDYAMDAEIESASGQLVFTVK